MIWQQESLKEQKQDRIIEDEIHGFQRSQFLHEMLVKEKFLQSIQNLRQDSVLTLIETYHQAGIHGMPSYIPVDISQIANIKWPMQE